MRAFYKNISLFRNYGKAFSLLLLLFLIGSLNPNSSLALGTSTWTTNGVGTTWSTAGNWSAVGASTSTYPGQTAGNTDIVVMNHNMTTTISVPNPISTLTINGVILTTNNRNITTTGIVTGTGTITSSSGTITSGGTVDVNTITFSSTGTLTVTGDINVSTLTCFSTNAVNLTGHWGVTTFTRATSTVTFNGGAQNINTATNFNNLAFNSAGNKTLFAAITVSNNLTMSSTAALISDIYQITGGAGTFTMAAGNTFSLGNIGDATDVTMPVFVTSYAFNAASTVTYQNSATQTVSGAPTYGDLTIATGGTKTLTSNLTVAGDLIVSAGTFDLGTIATTASVARTVTIDGTLSFNGTTTKTVSLTAAASTLSGVGTIDMSGGDLAHILNLAGTSNAITLLTTSAIASPQSTVKYNGTTQQVFASDNYRNLIISGNGVKTLQGNSTVNDDLTVMDVANATFTFGGAYTLGVSGNLSMNPNNAAGNYIVNVNTGIFNVAGVVSFGSAGTQQINVTSGSATFANAFTMSTASTTVSVQDGILTFNGLVTQSAGTLTNSATATGTINFNAGYNRSNAAATFTTRSGETINFGGDFTNVVGSPLTLLAGSNAVFNANAPVIYPTSLITFGNLTVNSAITVTLAGSITVAGTLNILNTSTAGILDLGTALTTLTVTGVTTINGTLLYNNTNIKTVTLTAAGSTLSGTGTIDMSGGDLAHILNLAGTSNAITLLTTSAIASPQSTVKYNGTTQQVFASDNYRNLIISGNGVKTLQGNSTVNDDLTVMDVANATFTFGGAYTLGVSGNLSMNPNNVGGNYIVNVNTGSLTVAGTVLSGGTGGTNTQINITSGSAAFTKVAGWSWPAEVNLTVSLAGSATWTAPLTLNTTATTLLISAADGVLTFNGLVSHSNGTISNTGAAGIINFNAGYDRSNAAATFTTLALETINFGGDFTNNANALVFNTTSYAVFNANTPNIFPTTAITFGNFKIESAVTVTLNGDISVANDWTNNNGVLTTDIAARTVTFMGIAGGAGNYINGTSATTFPYLVFSNNAGTVSVTLDVDASCTKLYIGLATNAGAVTLTHGVTNPAFTVNGDVILYEATNNVTRTWQINGGVAVITGTLAFSHSTAASAVESIILTDGSLTVSGAVSFSTNTNNARQVISITGAGSATFNSTVQTLATGILSDGTLSVTDAGTMTFAAYFNMEGGTVSVSATGTLNFNNSPAAFRYTSNSTPTFTTADGSVLNFNGDLTTVALALTFANGSECVFTADATITPGAALTIGNLTINPAVTLNLVGGNMTVTNDWTNSGLAFNHGNNTVTLSGIGQQTISKSGGTETFYNLTCANTLAANSTTIVLEASTDLTVTNTLTMQSAACIFNLNGRTFTLGSSGGASTLTGPSAARWMYGGTFKRFWPNLATITLAGNNYGTFPMGTVDAATYRPFTIVSTGALTADAYYTVNHVDAGTVTDLSVAQPEAITRVSDAQFLTTTSGNAFGGGTFTINVQMNGLSTTGAAIGANLHLAVSTGATTVGVVGTHVATTGSATAPLVKRNLVTAAELNQNNDFRVSTLDNAGHPLRDMFYSRASGGNMYWTNSTTWSTAGCNGAAGGSAPTANAFVTICAGDNVIIDGNSTADYVVINTGGILSDLGAAITFTVNKDITTAGSGVFSPTSSAAWTITRNATLAGSGTSSTSGAFNVTGNLAIGAGTTLNIGGNSIIAGNLSVDGTLGIGANTLTLSGTTKTISGSAGAATINGTGGTIEVTAGNKTVSSGSTLTIVPDIYISNAGVTTTITNRGTVTLTNNIRGIHATRSRWTNAANSTLNIGGALFTTTLGLLTANAAPNLVNYNGAGNQDVKVPNGSNYNQLTISNAGTKTLLAHTWVNSLATIKDAAICQTNNFALIGAGDFVMSGTSELQTQRQTTIPELTGTYNITGGTITFTGAGNQNLRALNAAPSAYYNVTVASTVLSTVTMLGNTTIQNNLTIAGGAFGRFSVSGTAYTLNIGGNWNVTSTAANPFTESTGIVNFIGTAPQTITTVLATGETFYNVNFNNTIGVALNSPLINVTNDLTINALGILSSGANALKVRNNWINNGGTFTPGTGTVTFDGTGAQSITKASAETFNNLWIATSGTKTTNCDLSLTGNLTIGNNPGPGGTPQLDMNTSNYNLSVGGDWTVTSTNANPFVERSGTVTFNGSALQTITTVLAAGETFYNLNFTNNIGGTRLTVRPITVNNDITFNNAALFDANGFNIALKGNWVNNSGTFTPGGGTVTLSGTGPQTITKTSGTETFNNLTSNTTGPITLEASTDVTVNTTLNMTAGLFDLNGRTLTLGTNGVASTLTRTASSTTNWVYGGTFKRFWPDNTALTISNYGLFPMGTSSASSYRPLEISTSANTATNGYFTVNHVDASTSTDLSPTGPESFARISDAQFLTAVSGLTGGVFNINVTMTGLSSVGTTPLDILGLATFSGGTTAGIVGTHLINTGTPANPTVKRTGVTIMELNLNSDFRVATTNTSSDPLRSFYYSRKTGNWDDVTPGDGTWSLTSGGAGASCDCVPPASAYVVISAGHIVTVNLVASIANVDIETGATLNGGFDFTVGKDLTIAGTGKITPTTGTWAITRNATFAGTGVSSCAGAFNVTGNLAVGSGTSLTLGTSSSVTGNLSVDGTLDIGTTTLTLNGTSGKTISGSAGAASIDGAGGILNITTASKTISTGTNLSIAPVFAINGAYTITNNGSITLTDNLTGTVAGSTWTNAANSTLSARAALLATGTLNASANGSTVNYSGGGAQSVNIPSSSTYYNLTISNAGTKTFATAGTISVTNLFTLTDAAVFDVSTNTFNGAADFTMSGTSELKLARSATQPELTGAYTISGGTITLYGAGIQTVRSLNAAPSAYYNIDFGGTTGAGVKSLAGAITVQGELKISGTAQLDVSASNFAITVAGNWNVTGTNVNPFIEQSGTVTFNGSSAQTINPGTVVAAETFKHLIINNSAGVSLLSFPITISGNLTISSGALFDANTQDITIAGNWVDNGGSFLCRTRTVTFNGTTQSITKSSTATFYNTIFSTSGTKTLGCDLAVNNFSILNTAQVDVSASNYAISVTGNWAVTSTNLNPFVERGGTTSFIGTTAQTIATVLAAGETFYNFVTTNNSVGIQLDNPIIVSGNLTINSGVLFLGNGKNISLAGNWTNSGGTFTPGTGTLTLTGSADKMITNTLGESFYDLTSNSTGIISFESNTDVTISNQLTMTAGNFNLNGRTLTLGNGSGAALVFTAGIVYGGNFKRYLDGGAISSTIAPRAGLFPIGTSTDYRPVEIISGTPALPGYLSASHIDAATVTDVTYTDNTPDAIQRITDMKSTLVSSGGLSGGTYSLNVTMTGLSSTGVTLANLKLETYTSSVMGSAGVVIATTGSFAAPTVGRSGLALTDLENDFVIGTKDLLTEPLQQFFYSRNGGGLLTTASTWSAVGCNGAASGSAPAANAHLTVCNGDIVTVDAVSTVAYVDINAGGTLDGAFNFTVTKDLTTAGTGIFAPTAGNWTISRNVTLVGTGSSILSGTSVITGNLSVGSGTTLTMNGGAGLTVAGNLTVDGTLALGTSTATLSGSAKTISGSGGAASITTGAGGTLNITSNKTIPSGTTLSIAPVFAITGAFTVTNNGTITLTGNLTGSVAGSTWTNAASSTLNAGDVLLTTGTLNASALGNTVNYTKAGAQSVKIPAASTYYNLSLSTSGTKTFATAGTISVSNLITIQDAAIFDVSTNTLSGAGGLTMSGTTELLLAKLSTTLPELVGTYNLTGGTIRFNGAGAQTVRSLNAAAPAAYYHVDFGGATGSGVKSLAGAISVQGVLNITGTAQLDVSASNYAIGLAGNWNNAGTNANPFIERSGTVTFNGTAAQTITCSVLLTETFDNLVISNTSGVTLLNHINSTSPTSTGNSLTIQSGALLVTTTYNIGLTGDWINNGGTFTPGTAMVTFNGTGAQSITKATSSTFYDITFGNSGTTTLACNLVVQRDLLISGTAKLDVSGTFYSIDVAGHWTVTSTLGDPFAERSGTVTFSGAAGQNQSTVLAAGETFYNLVVNNPIGVTLNSGGVIPTNVSNLLTISSSAILLGNNHNINVAGSWTNSGGTYTPGATGTVTFNGTGTQTITNATGEIFNNLISNTTGPLTLEASTDVTVSNTLTMTAGLYNLNGRTLTLGTNGVASALTRTVSSTTNWVYGGTFKRFWLNAVNITSTSGNYYGLFPMGTSSASSYRPVEINATGVTTDGCFTVNHVDASTVTDLSPVGPESIARISDAQFTTAISGVTAGTFDINVTMTGVSTTGTVPLDVLHLAVFTGGTTASVVGSHLINSGTPANPTVKRTGITTMSDLNNDFRVATTNTSTDPLQQLYYSRKTGNWNDVTPGDGTWSLISGGAGASCDCVPPTNGYAVISTGHTVSVNVVSTIAYVSIETGAILDGTSGFTVSKDLTTAGNGSFAPTAGAWTITRDATLVGTGNSSLSGISVITGNLSIGAGTTLTMNGGVSLGVAGNLTVDGTLALGTSIATLSGSAKTIGGSLGAASITTGVGGTINVTANKTISSGTILNIAPVFAIIGAFTVTNNGTITLTGNLTGSAAGSTWTNASSSTLNAGEALLSTGTLNASAIGNTVNYNKAGAQSVKIPAASTYYNLNLSTSGTKSFAGAGTISVSNLVTIQGAATIFDVSTNTLNGVAGLTMTGTSELLLAKLATTLPELTGSYSLSGGTIRFNGAGAQTIRSLNAAAPAAYYHVDFGVSGVKTLAGAISVQGVLNITLDAQLDVSASNYAINIAGNWNNAGTNANPFIERSGTVTFNGAAAQTITCSVLLTETFDNLVISNTSGVTLLNHINSTSPTSTGNSLTIQSGALLVTTTYNIGLTGDWINNGGTFTPGTGMVTFNGTGAQSITKASTSTFYDITFSNSGTTTLACNLVVQRDLLISGTAKLDVSGTFYSIDVARHWTVTSTLGDPFAERSGTVTFNGAAGQNQSTVLAAGETFYNLVINNPIGVTLNSGGVIPTNVSNLITLSLSSVLLGNNHNINVAGSWTNSGGTYTPGATGTVTFNGTGTQTITKSGGTETFNNLITNTTGPLTLEASTDVTVSNTLTMTAGLYNLNGRTLTLGTSGVASTLTRTASSTTNWVYGGTLKRFWPNGVTLTITDYGLFPMGTSTASSYRPVEISTTGGITTNGYFTVNHVDAATVTDLTVGSESMARISDAQFTTAISGVTAGTFAINVTMTGLSTTGTVPLDVLGLAIFTGGTTASVVGAHLINTGTPANPTVKRTGITTMSDLNNDFRVATTNVLTDPLQQLYYSRKTGNWNDATPGDATWSLVSGGAGASCDCTPPANAYAVISTGNTVSVNVVSTIAYVSIETGATLDGTSNFTASKDLITAGTGIFAPTAGAWTISRNATLVGTGSSSLSGTSVITGNLSIGAGTTLTMNGGVGLTVAGNLTVDGTLALGTSTATLSGSAKTISGSTGAASITGGSGTINVTANKTISSGTALSIAPVFAITGAFTVANSGSITLTGNLTGSVAGSTWTNAASSTLNVAGTVLTTGTLNASAANTVNYNLAGAQSVKTPASSYYNLILSNSGTKTFATAGTISVSNLVTVQDAAIFDVSTNTLSGAAGLAMSGTSELLLAKLSTTLPELTGTATYNLTGGTIRFKGAGAQTVRSLNAAAPAAYYHVDFGGTTGSGVKSLAGAISVQGVLNITGTAQLDVSASSYAINIAGNWNNAGTNANPFIEQSGTVTFNGTAAQTITCSVLLTETFDNLVISNSAGVTLLNHINVTSPTSTGNSLTIQSGALLVTTTYNIGLTGDWINNGGTFTPGTAMVTFNGNGAQSITKASASTFYDITFSNSGTTTLACNLVVQRDLLISGTAKLDVSGTFYSIDVARHWTVTSTLGDPFAERSGTVTFSGAAGQNQSTVLATGETFFILAINSTVTGLTLNSAGAIPTNVSNLLSIGASAFLLGNNHNINVAGSWTNSGGTYTPGATGTVTFNGTGTQTITKSGGTETFNNLISNTTGPLSLEASTDVTVSNTLTMTAGLYNLNGRTLTLGTSGVASTLTRTASSTTNWVYGGIFKRFWLNAVNITSTSGNYYGLFPMGTSNASSYRPVEINATGVTTDGYFTVNHVDAATVTDLTVGSESMTRMSDAQFTTAISGVTAGTFAINVTMTGLSTTGTVPLDVLGLAIFTGGTTASVVGTHLINTGTPANPTVKRTGIITISDLNNDFRVATTNISTDPLQQLYYSRKTGNWNDLTPGNGTWSLTSGGAGASCDCTPPTNGFAVISAGNTVSVNVVSSIAYLNIEAGATLNGTSNFTISKDLTTAGSGVIAPTAGTFSVRNLTLVGTGSSALSGSSTISGNLSVGAATTLTMNGGVSLSVAGNLTVDGTLALGTSTATLNGSAKTISGSTGAASITGSGATISVTANKTIPSGTTLSIAPVFAITGAFTVTNNGSITLTGNLTGSAAGSTWTNAASSTLNVAGAVLTTGTLNASANNTVYYNAAGAQTVKIPASTYYNVEFGNSGIKTMAGAMSVQTQLKISGTAQLYVSASNYAISLTGDWVNNGGTFTSGTGTVTFNGTGAQAINGTSASQTFYNLTQAKTAATALTVGGSTTTLTVNNLIQTSGDFNAAAASTALNINGSLTLTDGTFTAPTTTNIKGDWTKAVAATFTPGAGTVNFTGTAAAQSITGAAGTTFTNLTFNNTYGTAPQITLAQPTTITGAATFTAGVVASTATNLLILNDNATSNGGSSTSYVDGPVKKIGNEAFDFPIGDGLIWARLGITAPTTVTTSYTAQFFNAAYSDLTVDATIDHVSTGRYWTLEQAVNNDDVKVTLFWENASTNGISDCSDLTIGHYDGTNFVEEAATTELGSSCAGAGTGSITTNALVASYVNKQFTFASNTGNNVLPIELLSFDANLRKDNKVAITWVTATETNNDYFTVERTSDGINYEPIASIKGAGNSTQLLNYSTLDNKPLVGVSYYRLKQTDFDGQYKYSELVSVYFENSEEFSVFPNPSCGKTYLKIDKIEKGQEVLVVIEDLLGRKIYSKIVVVEKYGETITAIDANQKLPSGIYFISATSNDIIYRKKLVIQQ